MNEYTSFFEQTFYGNTIWEWLIAFSLMLLSVITARTVYWIFKKVIRRFTLKTKSQFDDILVDLIEEPVAFGIVLAGIWYSIQFHLHLSESVDNWIGKTFFMLTIFNIAWLTSRLFDAVLTHYIQPLVEKTENELDDQLLPIFRKGIRSMIWVTATIIALNNAGYDVGAVLAGLGIGGLAFALAAQDTVSNLFGGFTIFVDKPFTINDRIEVDGYNGYVIEIGMRTTRLRTRDGRMVVMPNSKVANNSITNITSEPSRKIVMELKLPYQTSPDKIELAMEILREIGEEHQVVIEDTVLVSFNKFDAYALGLLYIYFIRKESNKLSTLTSINMAILKRFNANDIRFAIPPNFSKSLNNEEYHALTDF